MDWLPLVMLQTRRQPSTMLPGGCWIFLMAGWMTKTSLLSRVSSFLSRASNVSSEVSQSITDGLKALRGDRPSPGPSPGHKTFSPKFKTI